MSYQDFREVLEIFDKYENNGLIQPGHDVLYAGPDPDIVDPEDMERLEELGWYEHEEGCFMKFA